MVYIFLEVISTLLLISSSLLLLFWKEGFSEKVYSLIRMIGICVFLIGSYKLLDVINYFYQINEIISSLSKIPALIGMILLMFKLFSFLEGKK